MQIEDLAHLVSGQEFHNLYRVSEITLEGVELETVRHIYQVMHNSKGHKYLVRDFGDVFVIFNNGYMTSFLTNLALNAMIASREINRDFGISNAKLARGLAKKFFAEQLFVHQDTRMARVLFLETLIEYDKYLREIIVFRTQLPELEHSTDTFSALATDFMHNHELGHVFSREKQFAAYMQEARKLLADQSEFATIYPDGNDMLEEEVAADIFGLNTVIGAYANRISGPRLKEYLVFLTIAVARMQVLYALADDSHALNQNPDHPQTELDAKLAVWQLREWAVMEFLRRYEFGEGSIIPVEKDDLLSLNIELSGIADISTSDLAEPENESSRMLAELIAQGFEENAGFDCVIEGTRGIRILHRP
ncbi:hypothetical protein [uncultured Cohaesibacter sp.]|uniref:hypothetical protein n=1 Tax=uncultured Cohaesibacter sp. TaxID=1002546 RepID=UPI00292E190D|nr:hypothetical protein [uncultured Cohaesibacter sp.]